MATAADYDDPCDSMSTEGAVERLDGKGGGIPKSKRKLQKHLRSAGLAYISRTGKLIPAKKVADELCQCPHKCDASVPTEARRRLFEHFYGLGEADLQNQFLRKHMDLRARLNAPTPPVGSTPPEGGGGGGRPPRRITCKYLVPLLPSEETVEVCQKAFVSAFVITTKRVRLQREKLIASLGLNSYSSHNRSKNNNNPALVNNNKLPVPSTTFEANNNLSQVTITKKPPRLTLLQHHQKSASSSIAASEDDVMELDSPEEEKGNEILRQAMASTSHHIRQYHNRAYGNYNRNHNTSSQQNPNQSDNPLIPLGLLVPEGVTIVPVTATPDHARDIAIVHNFFSNQLWKPEYIGAYS